MTRPLPALALLVAPALAAGCGDDPCSAEGLTALLAAARPGEVVSMGACEVRGQLTVPAGVSLRGAGPSSVLRADESPLRLTPGLAAHPTTVEALTVISGSGAAILAVGTATASDAVMVRDVSISVEAGIGVGVRGVEAGALERVSVAGVWTADRAAELPNAAGPDVGALGFVLIEVGTEDAAFRLVDVSVADIGPWGGLVEDSEVRWDGGRIEGITGTGVLAAGGTLEISDVALAEMRQGVQTLPPYGLVATASATVAAEGVAVERSEGVGVLVAGASQLSGDAMMVTEGRFGGLWAQEGSSIDLTGALFRGNGLAGITLVSSGATLEDARVEATVEELAIISELGMVSVGDGVQVLGLPLEVALRRVELIDNARVGLLVDAGAAPIERLSLDGTVVESRGAAFGAVAQAEGAVIPAGSWDAGLERRGAAVANDPRVSRPVDTLLAIPADSRPATPVAFELLVR